MLFTNYTCIMLSVSIFRLLPAVRFAGRTDGCHYSTIRIRIVNQMPPSNLERFHPLGDMVILQRNLPHLFLSLSLLFVMQIGAVAEVFRDEELRAM